MNLFAVEQTNDIFVNENHYIFSEMSQVLRERVLSVIEAERTFVQILCKKCDVDVDVGQ